MPLSHLHRWGRTSQPARWLKSRRPPPGSEVLSMASKSVRSRKREEVVFDENARRLFLQSFRNKNVKRKREAQLKAEKLKKAHLSAKRKEKRLKIKGFMESVKENGKEESGPTINAYDYNQNVEVSIDVRHFDL